MSRSRSSYFQLLQSISVIGNSYYENQHEDGQQSARFYNLNTLEINSYALKELLDALKIDLKAPALAACQPALSVFLSGEASLSISAQILKWELQTRSHGQPTLMKLDSSTLQMFYGSGYEIGAEKKDTIFLRALVHQVLSSLQERFVCMEWEYALLYKDYAQAGTSRWTSTILWRLLKSALLCLPKTGLVFFWEDMDACGFPVLPTGFEFLKNFRSILISLDMGHLFVISMREFSKDHTETWLQDFASDSNGALAFGSHIASSASPSPTLQSRIYVQNLAMPVYATTFAYIPSRMPELLLQNTLVFEGFALATSASADVWSLSQQKNSQSQIPHNLRLGCTSIGGTQESAKQSLKPLVLGHVTSWLLLSQKALHISELVHAVVLSCTWLRGSTGLDGFVDPCVSQSEVGASIAYEALEVLDQLREFTCFRDDLSICLLDEFRVLESSRFLTLRASVERAYLLQDEDILRFCIQILEQKFGIQVESINERNKAQKQQWDQSMVHVNHVVSEYLARFTSKSSEPISAELDEAFVGIVRYSASHWFEHYRQCFQTGIPDVNASKEIDFLILQRLDNSQFRQEWWNWLAKDPRSTQSSDSKLRYEPSLDFKGLEAASVLGLTRIVERLLEMHMDCNRKPRDRNSRDLIDEASLHRALVFAVERDHSVIASTFIQYGANIDDQTFTSAILRGQSQTVSSILKEIQLDKEAKGKWLLNRRIWNALNWAAGAGSFEVFEIIFDSSGGSHKFPKFEYRKEWDKVLQNAVIGGNVTILKLVLPLSSGVNVVTRFHCGEHFRTFDFGKRRVLETTGSLLMLASALGHLTMVNFLLEKGANAAIVDVDMSKGRNATNYAMRGDFNALRLLLQHNASRYPEVMRTTINLELRTLKWDYGHPNEIAYQLVYPDVAKHILHKQHTFFSPSLGCKRNPHRIFSIRPYDAVKYGDLELLGMLEDHVLIKSLAASRSSNPLTAAAERRHFRLLQYIRKTFEKSVPVTALIDAKVAAASNGSIPILATLLATQPERGSINELHKLLDRAINHGQVLTCYYLFSLKDTAQSHEYWQAFRLSKEEIFDIRFNRLSNACLSGNKVIFDLVVRQLARSKNLYIVLNKRGEGNQTLLHVAVSAGKSIEIIQQLLKYDEVRKTINEANPTVMLSSPQARLHDYGSPAQTPFGVASGPEFLNVSRRFHILCLLVRNGANLIEYSSCFRTFSGWIAYLSKLVADRCSERTMDGYVELLKLLIPKAKDNDSKDEFSDMVTDCFISAVRRDQREVVKVLLDLDPRLFHRKNFYKRTDDERTSKLAVEFALEIALYSAKNIDFVLKQLVAKGYKIDHGIRHGKKNKTWSHLAVDFGFADTLEIHLTQGASITIKAGKGGKTVFDSACRYGDVRCIEVLLRHGAWEHREISGNATSIMNNYIRPLENRDEILKLFLRYGIDLERVAEENRSGVV